MPDYGDFFLDTDLDGAVLVLRGVGTGDDLERRVYAGPRAVPNHECGRVAVYAARVSSALAELYATPSKLSRLRLHALTSGDVEGGPVRFEAVRLGAAAASRFAPERWGYLRLQAVLRNGLDVGDIVRIGTDDDNLRGSVRISDPNPSPTGFIALEVDSQGPFLFMTDGERTITLSPQGAEFWPNKAEWSFVADHPTDPGLEIHYAVLEGPEVGVYVRGTATLADGRAVVALPDHFGQVSSGQHLTAQLTPRSADSKGLAATRVTSRELVIEELFGGGGSYQVDWQVHDAQRGATGFEVVRPEACETHARPRPAARAAIRSRPGGG